MLLAIDIGNSNISVGLFDKAGKLLFLSSIDTDSRKTADQISIDLMNLFALYRYDLKDVTGAIFSSVVPPINFMMTKALTRLLGEPPMVVGPGVKTGLNIRMEVHNQLGADLVANAVAALEKYAPPIIMIDMGTATTISYISAKRSYEGGLMFPGVRLSLDALSDHTAQLPDISLQHPKQLIGKNTEDCMRSGIVYGTAGGRDFASLRSSIERITEVKAQLTAFTTGRLHELDNELDTLTDVAQSIRDTLIDEPPFSVREGGFIRKGYNAEVDRLHEILSGGKGLLADIETREKEKTGIRTLKIGYNKVFGYYIEVSNSFKDLVPDTYIRKQTLVNGERYITEELKNLEQEILTAGDRDKALEFEIFTALRESVTAESVRIQRAAGLIAELDTLCSLASVAVNNNYCRPSVDDSGVIEIHDGRHPVVERVLKDALFVPNDTYMGEREDRAAIITGPNMAGKSTYMRQVALITLMAQIGSFVPAKSARIGVVDRIFTRIGASDDLAGGQSTFMVEMTEVSEILHQATPRSLLILDEIGRGTSTFDGMSIARAVLEFCADPKRLGAKTLFATHYHELTELEGILPGVKNYSISIKKRGDELIFLRKIVPGGADRSYGIEVAKLAGLPNEVVKRANVILKELEQGGAYQAKPREETEQVSLDAIGEAEVLAAIRRAQPDTMSPIEAMQLLYELKQKLS